MLCRIVTRYAWRKRITCTSTGISCSSITIITIIITTSSHRSIANNRWESPDWPPPTLADSKSWRSNRNSFGNPLTSNCLTSLQIIHDHWAMGWNTHIRLPPAHRSHIPGRFLTITRPITIIFITRPSPIIIIITNRTRGLNWCSSRDRCWHVDRCCRRCPSPPFLYPRDRSSWNERRLFTDRPRPLTENEQRKDSHKETITHRSRSSRKSIRSNIERN